MRYIDNIAIRNLEKILANSTITDVLLFYYKSATCLTIISDAFKTARHHDLPINTPRLTMKVKSAVVVAVECRNQFRCNNGRCIPYMYRCNAITDCEDGSDEQGCSKSCSSRVLYVVVFIVSVSLFAKS